MRIWRKSGLLIKAAKSLALVLLVAGAWTLLPSSHRNKGALPLGGNAENLGQASYTPATSISGPIATPVQLPYASVSDDVLKLPSDLRSDRALPREVPGRRVPELTRVTDLLSPALASRVVPLPEANTLAHLNFQSRRFGQVQGSDGSLRFFNPESILVKFRGARHVGALRVEPMHESDAVRILATRNDVQFAELDLFQERQFASNDPGIGSQWHHPLIGSFQAWNHGLGNASVQVAIVDTPFQMAHPDLAPNTVSGWDAVANVPVTAAPGIVHSTLCAGLAAAVINNDVGVAGAANCQVLPININGAISEMYNAIVWAADHGVRVVSISWSGGDSDTLEAAGSYLKTHARGLLVMAAIDGSGTLNWVNQPDIYCIAMTDAADNFSGTHNGPYIDFAAPGFQIVSTTTGGGYAIGTGASYATPLFAGVVAWMFALNPTLGPDDVVNILQSTAKDLGPAGYDPYFGWGRVNFGAAADAASATLPALSGSRLQGGQFSVAVAWHPGLIYSLWRAGQLAPPAWAPVVNATIITNGPQLVVRDPAPLPGAAFYRIQANLP